MHKRIVKLGPKHGTATFYLSGENIPLNFNDLALHVSLTANDNIHRQKPQYPKEKQINFLTQVVELGYSFKQIKTQEDLKVFREELNKIYKNFYGRRMNAVNLKVDCELPNKNGSIKDFG